MNIKPENITRVEVIDEKGRVYSELNLNVEISIQDGGKTMKVFVNKQKGKR